MKRRITAFHKKPRKPLKRSGFKTKKVVKKKKRAKLTPIPTLRKRCDALCTPVIKKMYPKCEACGHDTEVAHHWIEKSRSNFLRYVLENLIPLCHSCHSKIHNRFGNSVTGSLDVAEIIIGKRGREWKERLDRHQKKYIKVDREYFTENIAVLSRLLDS